MALENLDHISQSRRHLATLDDNSRFQVILKDCWVNHSEVNSVRSVIRAVYEMPPTTQAQCVVVSGVSGMGKTSLFNKVASDFDLLRKRHHDPRSYISFTLAPDPSLKGFEESMGAALGVPFGSIRNGLIPKPFVRMARLRSIKAVMIDEIHDLLNANKVEQRKVLTFFRSMTGPPLSLSLIAFGTQDAKFALASDDQLDRRFEKYELNRWKEDEAFRSFLAAYESLLPLKKPSELWRQEKVRYLLNATLGITDGIVKRIKRGAIWAIMDQKEQIDMECLAKAAFIPPYVDYKKYEK
ncbi:TniB family NTP-binding protein [Pseudomonas silvicola]|nr:TniB family NTP-binding protein [Pseudomonas silvicola]